MRSKSLRGVHVLWIVAAFFALVVSVDAFFIVRAVATFPGEQVRNSYVLGLDFNREVQRRERQRDLGWRAEAGVIDDGGQVLVVRLRSETGQPVSGLEVSAHVVSAAANRIDEVIALEERASGDYVAPVSLPNHARAEIGISAVSPGKDGPVFEAVKTLVIS